MDWAPSKTALQIVKLQHWRGFQAKNASNTAPMLAFLFQIRKFKNVRR